MGSMAMSFSLGALVNQTADQFESAHGTPVTQDGRQALIEPARPYESHVQTELARGNVTYQFLEQSVTTVLDNGLDIAKSENMAVINAYVVKKSMKKYCPYIMWC